MTEQEKERAVHLLALSLGVLFMFFAACVAVIKLAFFL